MDIFLFLIINNYEQIITGLGTKWYYPNDKKL